MGCNHSIFYKSCPSCLRVRIAELEAQLAEMRQLLFAIEAVQDDGVYLYPTDKDTLPEHWLAKRDALPCWERSE